jgi:hypothetical protein
VITQVSNSLPCPRCGARTRFWAISVIDADDQPDWRDKIVDRTLSQEACGNCGTLFRMQPAFAYFDRAHDQWIGAFPWDERDHWRECEQRAQSLYEVYLHADTAMSARMREAPLNRRVTFGWEALREKIVAAGRGLEDVTLELAKQKISRKSRSPADDDSDLRLLDADAEELVLGRVVRAAEAIEEQWSIPRAEYDKLAVGAGTRARRAALTEGTYVDLRRLRGTGQ